MAAPRRRASRTASASAALAASSLAWASLYARAASLTASSPSLFTSHLLTVRYVPYHTGLVWGLAESQAESWADTPHAKKRGERGQCRTPLPITHVSPGRSRIPRDWGSPHAWGRRWENSPETCRKLVHPHMRGEQLRGPDRTIPTCVGLMCMNLTAPPCSAQPGTALSLNFGDVALRSSSSTSSARLPC